MIKVALILERFNLARGGAERSCYEMACSLSRLGLDMTILAGKINHDGVENDAIKLLQVPVEGINRAIWWRNFEKAMTRQIKNDGYDIVHSMAPLICAHVYQPRGGSITNGEIQHCRSFECQAYRFFKQVTGRLNRGRAVRIAAEQKLCRAPDGPVLAALSEYVVQQFQRDYQLDPQRIRLIANGVMTDEYRSQKTIEQGQKLRKIYDRQDNLTLFVFAAENFRLKGLNELLRAAAIAKQQIKPPLRDFRILVVSNNDYTSYWARAQKLGLAGRVMFMGHCGQMGPLLRMCDAVVLPTYNDACSRIILEGLAAGRPGITTKFNGAADFLGQGKYGFVIDRANDIQALVGALLELCDPARQNSMCRAIENDRLYQRVSMDRHAKELLQLYEELIMS